MPDVQGSLNVKSDGYLVTGDVNIAHMQLRVRYRARDDEQGALDYAFRMPKIIPGDPKKGPQELLKQLVVQSTIETVGTWEVLDVLRKTRGLQQIGAAQEKDEGPVPVRGLLEEIEAKVQEKLQQFEQANGFSAGVRLTAIEFVGDPVVPERVQQSFYQAIMADSEMRKIVDEAKKQAQIIAEAAKGKKAGILSEAETYKNRLISNAKADAGMLTKLVTACDSSPEEADILRTWHFERMMEDFLGSGKGIFVVHRPNEGSNTQYRFFFGKPPRKAKPAQQPEQQQQGGR
jgi:membrane protease subunit HflK